MEVPDTGGLRRLWCEDFRRSAERIRAGLDYFGIKLHSQSDLAIILGHLDWVGAHDGDPYQVCRGTETDSRRLAEAILRLEQADRIGAVLVRVQQCEGAGSIANKWVKKRLDRVSVHDERAQDFLFELEIGARLLSSGFDVVFAEPDVQVRLHDEARISIACKRPRKQTTVGRCVKDARDQIVGSGVPGLILLNFEAIIHEQGVGDKPLWFQVANQQQLKEMVARRTGGILASESVAKAIAEYLTPEIIGVIGCALITAMCKNPSGEIWYWCRHAIPNIEGEYNALLTDWIREILGEPL